ncbi:DUF5681 domain-containing protein [Roseibium sp.]|uniref:DUF5681 domain-containing protein n=1 Tax=Roseibium sp. TaxID=1936156 RepID=UPI003D0D1C85
MTGKNGQDLVPCNSYQPGTELYEVGYGKPPKATRFKKGQSGTPKGRPRKRQSMKGLLEEQLASTITITEAGEPRQITRLDAFLQSLMARAIKGDNRAADHLLKLMDQLDVAGPSDDGPPVVNIVIEGVSPPERDD